MSWIYGKTEQNILSRGFITFFQYGPFFFVIRIVRKWNYWKSLVLQRWGDHRLRPGRDENTVDRAEGTFEKIPYQQFPNFFLISSGFLITRKKRPAVRDKYYGMETKTENPLKRFFLPVPNTMLQIHHQLFQIACQGMTFLLKHWLYHFKLKLPDVGNYSFTTRCALKQTIRSVKENFFTLLRYAQISDCTSMRSRWQNE